MPDSAGGAVPCLMGAKTELISILVSISLTEVVP